MKIVVIHGDDVLRARERFVQIIHAVKRKGWEVVRVVSGRPLSEQLVAGSLFGGEHLFVLDGVKKTTPNEFKWLSKNADKYEGSFLVYSGGLLPALLKKALPKSAKIETFSLPVVVWQFLDSFYPGNRKVSFSMLEKFLEESAPEMVIAMLGRHLRDLYWAREGGAGMNLPSWRASKLKAQAAKFTKEKLGDTINELADIDFKSKTSDFDARLGLEILISEKLS